MIDQEIALQQEVERERDILRRLAYQKELGFEQSRRIIEMNEAR